jgi:hypothetical protein
MCWFMPKAAVAIQLFGYSIQLFRGFQGFRGELKPYKYRLWVTAK